MIKSVCCIGSFSHVRKGVQQMGKNLKGKECGNGICQRKDGRYCARFVDRNGKRRYHYFTSLPEARNWLADAQYENRHGTVLASSDMTVDAWYQYWSETIIAGLVPNTLRNYRDRYIHNIQPVIGSMLLADVKQFHCKMVLNIWKMPMRVPQLCRRISRWGPCSNQHS